MVQNRSFCCRPGRRGWKADVLCWWGCNSRWRRRFAYPPNQVAALAVPSQTQPHASYNGSTDYPCHDTTAGTLEQHKLRLDATWRDLAVDSVRAYMVHRLPVSAIRRYVAQCRCRKTARGRRDCFVLSLAETINQLSSRK